MRAKFSAGDRICYKTNRHYRATVISRKADKYWIQWDTDRMDEEPRQYDVEAIDSGYVKVTKLNEALS